VPATCRDIDADPVISHDRGVSDGLRRLGYRERFLRGCDRSDSAAEPLALSKRKRACQRVSSSFILAIATARAGSRHRPQGARSAGFTIEKIQQIHPITGLHLQLCPFPQFVVGEKTASPADLLGHADLQTLAVLDGADEVARVK
jgi:hypothetical protein